MKVTLGDTLRIDPRIIDQLPKGFSPANILVLGHVGSIAHGTHTPSHDPNSIDDVDLMGVFMPPERYILGLDSWEHWVTQIEELDITFYGLPKMIRLMLKSNPNVLGMLWLDEYLVTTPEFECFRAIRDSFASKQAYDSFAGYANAQLQKLESGAYKGYMGERRRELVRRFGYDPKNAAHLIRLLRMAIEFLESGQLCVKRTYDAEELKAIKRGEWRLDQIQACSSELFDQARRAKEGSPLPDRPDRQKIEGVLIDVMRARLFR